MAHTLWRVLLCGSEQIRLLSITVSLTEILQWDIKSLSFIRSWSQASWVLAGLNLGREELKDRRRKQWKNVPRNPFHNLPENLLNTWPVLTVFISLILGTKKIKDRRTPTGLGNSYKSTQDSGAFRTHWGVSCSESFNCTHYRSPVCGGLRKQEMRNWKGIKIFLGICSSSHRTEDILP